MKTQNFAPMRYPVIRITVCTVGASAQLWAVQHFLLGRATCCGPICCAGWVASNI